jgi:hypothetical protein
MRKKHKKILGIILILCAIGLLILGGRSREDLFDRHSREGGSPIRLAEQGGDPDVKNVDSRLRGNDVIENKNNSITQNLAGETKKEAVVESKKATLTIGDKNFTLTITDKTTVYDAMQTLASNGELSFEGKQYTGLGFFVTSIGSLQSGAGKNLMYYVNGEEAGLGVSSYIIKGGDKIEWKLK